MHYQIFFQQLRRGKRRSLLYLLLLLAATAFFVMSLNLYRNSLDNLAAANENFRTLAIMELQGNVDKYGQPVPRSDPDSVGRRSVESSSFDMGPFVQAAGVKDYDLRRKFGAYIPGQIAIDSILGDGFANSGDYHPRYGINVLRFVVTHDSPIHIPIGWNINRDSDFSDIESSKIVSANITWKAFEGYEHNPGGFDFRGISFHELDMPNAYNVYSEEIKRLNRSDTVDEIILYPGVEYIMCNWDSATDLQQNDSGTKLFDLYAGKQYRPLPVADLTFSTYRAQRYTDYTTPNRFNPQFKQAYHELGHPFPLQRWEDVQNDPELLQWFREFSQVAAIQNCIFNVDTTNDFSSIPGFHMDSIALMEGRLISREEYASGAKVCLISQQMATVQNWQLGDKLDLRLFEADYFFNGVSRVNYIYGQSSGAYQPEYVLGETEFFHQGEYEIVGIFGDKPSSGNAGIDPSTLAVPWFSIYIPEASVEQLSLDEKPMIHGSLFSLTLENGAIDDFLNDITARGLLEEKDGQLTPVFSFYDQGYSLVQPGLEAMNSTAKLLLILSAALLLVVCILLAYFFSQNQRPTMGVFRLLGGSKKQTLSAVMACALALTMLGAAAGSLLGFGLAQGVGSSIMAANRRATQADAAYQAYVIPGQGEDAAVSVQADPLLTVLAGSSAALFPLLTLGLVAADLQKEPRELLPKAKL